MPIPFKLGAANRIARLLVPIAIVGASARTLRFVFGDAGLILELGEERRQLRDLSHDPLHARQLVVRLFDGVGSKPLHGSTI
jgi:hypothetical protein